MLEGGVKKLCHTKAMSENILEVKFNCAHFSWPNIPGGYMKRVLFEISAEDRKCLRARLVGADARRSSDAL